MTGTVASDQNTLLRGRPLDFRSGWPSYTLNASNWKATRDRGLNVVRLVLRGTDNGSRYSVSDVDKCVDIAAGLGMYIIIDNHYRTTTTQSNLTSFWNTYAPRYKDRKHVIYELINEPDLIKWIGWNNAAKVVEATYKQVRAAAPNTHIICWSTTCVPHDSTIRKAPGIDYSNASVGFHYYCTLYPMASLKAKYPIICTEWWQGAELVKRCEPYGVSWIPWERTIDGNTSETPGTFLPDMDKIIAQLKTAGISWRQDNWTAPPTSVIRPQAFVALPPAVRKMNSFSKQRSPQAVHLLPNGRVRTDLRSRLPGIVLAPGH